MSPYSSSTFILLQHLLMRPRRLICSLCVFLCCSAPVFFSNDASLFFKIAYMDHLNIPTDRGTHQINYSTPRISNVTNEDFEFVMKVDRNRMSLDNAYGRLPVSHFSSSSLRPFPFLSFFF